ncbi:hypothetical protein ACFY2Z_05155 [Streptomyces sp. NPDC001222]|uniref:hypothetical protein n=1 Tax=Streptomyces sp. NPDC001222 TaxID=3364548 RepID=UPI0036B1279D
MSVEANDRPGLTDAYATRVRADLERVDAEIVEVQARLKALAVDRALLSKLWENIFGESGPMSPVTESGPAEAPRSPLPEEASAPENGSGAGERRRPGGRRRGPLVRDVVLEFLREATEPVSVRDVHVALRSSPIAPPGKVVVRNTLESLVAKGVARRCRDGQSVRYSVEGAQEPQTES